MNDCVNDELRDMLPDLLHGTLPVADRSRVETHVATCSGCREELDVLRAVKSAAVFTPLIDVNRVVRQIPPYQTITPAIGRKTARGRGVMWLVAASVALVLAGGGSVLVMQRPAEVAASRASAPSAVVQTREVAATAGEPMENARTEAPNSAATSPHALALSTDVASLSDANLAQLMDDMDGFDGLPAAEPEPVIAVDSVSGFEQDSSL